ncbi:MAG: ATP-binding protein [Micropepsaceae bacterium]
MNDAPPDRSSSIQTVENHAGQETRLALALSLIADGIWDWSIQGDSLFSTDQCALLLGYEPTDYPATSMRELVKLIHPDDIDEVTQAMTAHLETRKPYNVKHRIRLKDGSYKWFRAHGKAIWTDDGRPIRMLGSFCDIDEFVSLKAHAHAAETREKSLHRLMGEILSLSPEAIVISDEHMIIRSFNKGAEIAFGWRAEECVGRHIELLIPARFRGTHHHHVRDFSDGTAPSRWMSQRSNIMGLHKDGHEFPAAASISKISTDTGTNFAVVMRDVSAEREAAANLLQAKDQAEIANRLKSQFLANMSHEIRTPMNAVMGMCQLLERTSLTETQQKYARTILESGKHLLALVNDILDLSKIEAGALKLDMEIIDVGALVGNTVARVETIARQKNLEMRIENSIDGNRKFFGDRNRLSQVLANLLGNAIKFTDAGGLVIGVDHESDSLTRFWIRDTGCGIAADQFGVIFERFRQVDGTSTRKHGGAGLGLSICKELIGLMGGKIGVESTLGQGTLMWFTVPTEWVTSPEQ